MKRARDQLALPIDLELDGSGVRIAVLDPGIDTEHPDLADRIDRDASASFTLGSDLTDRHGHGTHVAGLIAGTGTVDFSLRGVAPGADLIIIKIASAVGSARGPVYVDPALSKNAVVARADLALDQIESESYPKPDIVVPGGGSPSCTWGDGRS